MLNQEDNKKIDEFSNSKELNRDPKEYPMVREFATQNEMKLTQEEQTAKKIERLKKKDPKLAAQAASATAVIGFASFMVIASSGLINVTMDGSIDTLTYQDNSIVYKINVSDVEKDNDIYFELFDGSKSLMKYTIEFDHPEKFEGELEGIFSIADLNLKEKYEKTGKVSFDVHLCGDTGLVDRTYDSKTIEITAFTSEFTGVDGYCDCENNGGYFVFNMDFTDDYSIFTDFDAYLTDANGKVSHCVFSDNLHETQKIGVLDLQAGTATFTLSYKREGEPVSYSAECDI